MKHYLQCTLINSIIIIITLSHLFWTLPAPRSGLGLEFDDGGQHVESLVLGEGDVRIVVKSEDLGGVINGQTLHIGQVTLKHSAAQLHNSPFQKLALLFSAEN